MVVGAYGPVVFSVSSDVVRTFREVTRERGSAFAQHQPIGRAARLEPLHDELDKVTLEVHLDHDLGTLPALELLALNELKQLQRPWPLLLGMFPVGEFVITRISENWTRFSRAGALMKVSVSLELLEDSEGPFSASLKRRLRRGA